MTAAELVAHLRNNVLRDSVAPALWDSEELATYLSEGERLFARRTHCIVDEAEPLSLLEAKAGVHTYTLNKKIIHVYEITNSEGLPLKARSRNQLPKVFAEGKPYAFTTGRGSNTVRLAPTPAEDEDLTMLVARLPLRGFSNSSYTPEIPEEYHINLCDWAAYKAMVNNDPEGSNTAAAGDFLIRWEAALREAKRNVFRLRTPDGATVRNNWTGERR